MQSQQLGKYLSTLSDPPISHVYSSPFYRCLQTIEPYVLSLPPGCQHVKGDNGIGEWYGHARFTHPSPATPALLNELFPFYDRDYQPSIIPSKQGETIEELHQRCAYALQFIIAEEDAADVAEEKATGQERERALLICTHAASMIAIGRALTGFVPKDLAEDDFKTYTCGVSKFVRNIEEPTAHLPKHKLQRWTPGTDIPEVDFKDGKGVGGGWTCVINCTCEHLEDGEERGWYVLHRNPAFRFRLKAPLTFWAGVSKTRKLLCEFYEIGLIRRTLQAFCRR